MAAMVAVLAFAQGASASPGDRVTTAADLTARTKSAQMQVRPTSGPPGTHVLVKGTGFVTFLTCTLKMYFVDGSGTKTFLKDIPNLQDWRARAIIPDGAALGVGEFTVEKTLKQYFGCSQPAVEASAPFTVSPDLKGRSLP